MRKRTTPTPNRDNLATLMQTTVKDQATHGTWTYQAVRPMPVPPSWKVGQYVRGDCSKGVQFLCRWADLPDPMHHEYDAYYNSATLCLELAHINLSDVEVGDIVTFGPHGDEHAAMVYALVKRGHKTVDLNLWSFGHQGAPNTYLLSQDHRVYQLLRVRLGVHHVKTPPSVLRAKEGYWSWRQWRLGTGDWRGYGRRKRSVRPNVPRRIPAGWWMLFARSLPKQRKRRPNRVTLGTLKAGHL